MKRHFAIGNATACGRGSRPTDDVRYVTCQLCKNTPAFKDEEARFLHAKMLAFYAQVPSTFNEPWIREAQHITCRECGGTYFRQGDRSCHGHYENYHCANSACDGTEQRLTETGMSF